MTQYRAADLDAFPWQDPIIDRDLSAPPGSPAKGDRYIIKATGTGDWAGHDNAITYYTGAAWVFIAPVEGLVCWIKDEDLLVRHNGAAWDVLVPAGSGMGYVLNLLALALSTIVSGSTYYFGGLIITLGTTAGLSRIYIPKDGTIKVAYIYSNAGTAGSAEAISVYIRKNGTTDYLVATLSISNNIRLFYNTALNIAVAQGDYLEIKVVCPEWVTVPYNWRWGGTIYIE